jgi:hypothetical protein
MILTKEIEVRLNNKNIDHYKELLNCNYIHGFKNNIDSETISSIDNLCITKKTNNSSKSFLNEKEFKQKIQS